MNKKSLAILCIISAGIMSIAYASSGTIITDTSITTPNLTVTGTCTGCGAGEGSFSSYVLNINFTSPASTGPVTASDILIDNTGSIQIINGDDKLFIFNNLGSLINSYSNSYSGSLHFDSQSLTGEYRVFLSTNNGTLYIYKNLIKIQSNVIGITTGQNGFQSMIGSGSLNISPNGQYIVIAAPDATNFHLLRIVEYKGS